MDLLPVTLNDEAGYALLRGRYHKLRGTAVFGAGAGAGAGADQPYHHHLYDRHRRSAAATKAGTLGEGTYATVLRYVSRVPVAVVSRGM